jgi:hypothetical protein
MWALSACTMAPCSSMRSCLDTSCSAPCRTTPTAPPHNETPSASATQSDRHLEILQARELVQEALDRVSQVVLQATAKVLGLWNGSIRCHHQPPPLPPKSARNRAHLPLGRSESGPGSSSGTHPSRTLSTQAPPGGRLPFHTAPMRHPPTTMGPLPAHPVHSPISGPTPAPSVCTWASSLPCDTGAPLACAACAKLSIRR